MASNTPKGNKFRRLGMLRNSTVSTGREGIPKLSPLNPNSHIPPIEGNMNGVTGSAMSVPPQKEKSNAREIEKPKPKSETSKPDSASSSKSQERKENKELQDLRNREKDLLKQIASLKKLVAELQEKIQEHEQTIELLKGDLSSQETKHQKQLSNLEKENKETKDKLATECETNKSLKTEIEQLKLENASLAEKIKAEWEEKLKLLTEEKDKEIKIRDEKLNRLKSQMADALKGNSWERQQQLEELTKELSRIQEEADILRMKLKAAKGKGSSPSSCTNCQEHISRLEKLQATLKEKEVNIKELNSLCIKFEKQLNQQDDIMKIMANKTGFKQ